MYSVKLQNIRGIRELVFPFPAKSGVYVLTGSNGCGKTSLMVALNRLGKRWAFSTFPTSTHGNRMDLFRNSSVTYTTPNGEVTYKHGHARWTPTPRRNNNLLSQFPFRETIFVTASSSRFFTQNAQLVPRTHVQNANQATKDAMNSILETQRFDNLQYCTVNPGGNRKKYFYRSDKLYFINNHGNIYSESNFSFGESLLLNTLNALENIQPRTLLLIDEAELALHPRAQVRLYDYLEEQAINNDLAIIISTHSSTLIRHAKHRIYLEKAENGSVEVLNNCYPAYILKNIAGLDDLQVDVLLFVEDERAKFYLQNVLLQFKRENLNLPIYCIVPIGGFKNVIEFLYNLPNMAVTTNNVHVFLDADAKDAIDDLQQKPNKTQANLQLLEKVNSNINKIHYLPITPELGVWEWIENNKATFKAFFEGEHGAQPFSIVNLLNEASNENLAQKPIDEEQPTYAPQLRQWAKKCFNAFIWKIHTNNPQISSNDVEKDLIKCYVNNIYAQVEQERDRLRNLIIPCLR